MIIALFEPEIPQNTGNIARLCAATGIPLKLVGRLGFSLSDKYLKRAGMDYWEYVNWEWIKTVDEFFNLFDKSQFRYAFISKFGKMFYSEIPYSDNLILIFGNESRGLPENVRKEYDDSLYRIPMREGIRSLNLATSVGIVTYHLLEKSGFNGLI